MKNYTVAFRSFIHSLAFMDTFGCPVPKNSGYNDPNTAVNQNV